MSFLSLVTGHLSFVSEILSYSGTLVACDACGNLGIMPAECTGIMPPHWSEPLDGGFLFGCRECGHIMVFQDRRQRRLTPDEARRVQAADWFEDLIFLRDSVIAHLWG